MRHEGRVNCVAFSPEGLRLAAGGNDKPVRLWDAYSGVALDHAPMRHEGRVNCVAFSPDGLRLASGSYDGTVRLWDAHSGVALDYAPMRHEDVVACVAFSLDGRWLLSSGVDRRLRVWSVPGGTLLHELQLETIARALRFNAPDRLRLACEGHQLHTLAILEFRARNFRF